MARLKQFPQHFAYMHGWYESKDYIFLAMDFFDLGDLSKHLSVAMAEDQAKDVTRQLCNGLRELHRMGFAHRDLKPQNIFVVARYPPLWEVRIGDFGISKRVQEDETALRTMRGTLAYMAPEMIAYFTDGEEMDPYSQAVDMWALGVVLFQMVTTKLAFSELHLQHRYFKGRTEFPVAPLLVANVTSQAVEFVKSLLQARPGDRPTSEDIMSHAWLSGMAAQRRMADLWSPDLATPVSTLSSDGPSASSQDDSSTNVPDLPAYFSSMAVGDQEPNVPAYQGSVVHATTPTPTILPFQEPVQLWKSVQEDSEASRENHEENMPSTNVAFSSGLKEVSDLSIETLPGREDTVGVHVKPDTRSQVVLPLFDSGKPLMPVYAQSSISARRPPVLERLAHTIKLSKNRSTVKLLSERDASTKESDSRSDSSMRSQQPLTTFYVPDPDPVIQDSEPPKLDRSDRITAAISGELSSELNSAPSQDPGTQRVLPYGWQSYEDHLGREYYVDQINRRSTRHRPSHVGYPAEQPVMRSHGRVEQIAEGLPAAHQSHDNLEVDKSVNTKRASRKLQKPSSDFQPVTLKTLEKKGTGSRLFMRVVEALVR